MSAPREMRTVAVVVAGGAGVRMGAGMPKALVPLAGRPLVSWCLEALTAAEPVDGIVLVAPRGHGAAVRHALGDRGSRGLLDVVPGGATRQRSVLEGLRALPAGVERVVVHDAARPLVTPQLVEAVLEAVEGADGAIAAAPMADTVKRALPAGPGEDLVIAETLERAELWRAETPQAFVAGSLREAFALAPEAAIDAATDCATLVEAAGGRVRIVPSLGANLKVTTPADLDVAEGLLRAAGRLA